MGEAARKAQELEEAQPVLAAASQVPGADQVQDGDESSVSASQVPGAGSVSASQVPGAVPAAADQVQDGGERPREAQAATANRFKKVITNPKNVAVAGIVAGSIGVIGITAQRI